MLQSPNCRVLQHLLQLEGKRRGGKQDSKCTYLYLKNVFVTGHFLSLTHTYLSQGGLLVPQADDEDAVSLADAALSPWGHAAVSLVQDNSIDVLLLGQPAGQTVLMDADGNRRRAGMKIWKRALIHQNRHRQKLRAKSDRS